MPMIICAKYGKNPSRTVCAVKRTWQDVTYFSSYIAKSWLNDIQDIGQGQRSLCMTHPLMIVIICAWYGKNPFRTVGATERNGRMDGVNLCGGYNYYKTSVFMNSAGLMNDLKYNQVTRHSKQYLYHDRALSRHFWQIPVGQSSPFHCTHSGVFPAVSWWLGSAL